MQENKGRVLVVDDDHDTCEMMKILLSHAGYETVTSKTVSECLRLVCNTAFDLILLDWYLEDGTGENLCQKIRAFDADTPIFFCTGEARQSELNRALAAGAQGFFIKPINLIEMMTTITRQMCQHSLAVQ